MSNFLIMTGYQIRLLSRNFKSLVLGFSLPILMFLVFGNLLGAYQVYEDVGLAQLLVPAYIPIIIINGALVIYGHNYMVYKERGMLVKYRLLGMHPLALSASMYAATLLFQVLAIAALIVFASLTKGVAFPVGQLPSLIGMFIVINILQFSLTFLLTTLIDKSATYQSVSLVLFYYQIFLGGLTFPPEMFPGPLNDIVHVTNPIIYGLEAIRDVWLGNAGFAQEGRDVFVLLGCSLLFVLLGLAAGRWRLGSSVALEKRGLGYGR